MGNPAVRPQIGVTDVGSVIDTGNADLTGAGVSSIPTSTWTQITSGTPATIDTALTNAGYVKCDFEFSDGVVTSVRLLVFLTT